METQPDINYINGIIEKQKAFFKSGTTKSLKFRKQQLKKLDKILTDNSAKMDEALAVDLGMHPYEAMTIDYAPVHAEIRFILQNIDKWVTPEVVPTSLFHFPGSSKIVREPYGNTFIISPWNYPFRLSFMPIATAIAAGNTVVLKPSEVSGASSKLIAEMINHHFDEGFIHVIEGGVELTTEMLKKKWDLVYFTGSPAVGKIVYQAAAQHLTPVILELGGKNPAIIARDANITLAAKRIMWGKLIKTGQTCVAPDYLFVHESVKDKFINALKAEIEKAYGSNPLESESYGKIINDRHYQRLKSYLNDGKIILGGRFDDARHKIEPTLLMDVSPDSKVMTEEIFGPILPVYTFNQMEEAIAFSNERDIPLSAYIFSKSGATRQKFVEQIQCGNACENDTILQISASQMPFGGVGNSGIGTTHGKHGFDSFSHLKSVLYRGPQGTDPFLRYAPYKKGKTGLMKFLIRKLL